MDGDARRGVGEPPDPGPCDGGFVDIEDVALTATPRTYHTRWIYFALFAWLQCNGRFMSLYYLHEGLTEAQIGLVFACGSVTSFFTCSALSVFADYLASMRGASARLQVFFACVLWVTVVFSLQAVQWPGVPRYRVMLVCRVLSDAVRSATTSLLDAITVRSLPDRQMYGTERLYGAYSWAIVGLGLGALMDRFGPRVAHVCMPFALFGVIAALVQAGQLVEHAPRAGGSCTSPTAAPVSGEGIRLLVKGYLASASKVTFFIYAMTLGVGMTLVENLLFLFFHDLHASYFVCGLSVVVTVLFEIPLFACSKQLFRIFGARGCLIVTGLCYSFRVVGYTLVPGGAWVLLFEPMHGVTYAFWQTASVEVMASITPPHLAATGQTFLSSLRSLVGVTTGNICGGLVIDAFGEATLYRSAAVLVGFGLLLYLAANRRPAGAPRLVDGSPG